MRNEIKYFVPKIITGEEIVALLTRFETTIWYGIDVANVVRCSDGDEGKWYAFATHEGVL